MVSETNAGAHGSRSYYFTATPIAAPWGKNPRTSPPGPDRCPHEHRTIEAALRCIERHTRALGQVWRRMGRDGLDAPVSRVVYEVRGEVVTRVDME